MANGIRTGDPVDSIKDVVRSSVKVPGFDKHLKKAGGHIDRNVVEITIKMKTIVRKPLMIKKRLGNNKTIGDHQSYRIDEIGQNTEKSPGDLR